jgi:hypothetical protein
VTSGAEVHQRLPVVAALHEQLGQLDGDEGARLARRQGFELRAQVVQSLNIGSHGRHDCTRIEQLAGAQTEGRRMTPLP